MKISLRLGEKTGEANRRIVTSHPVEIMPLQYAIPAFPCVIVLPLLHQPTIEIGSSNLLEDAATLHKTGSVARRCWNRRFWCSSARAPLPQEGLISLYSRGRILKTLHLVQSGLSRTKFPDIML